MIDDCANHVRELRSLSIQCMEKFATQKGVKPVECWLGVYVSDEQKLISIMSWKGDLAEVCNVSGIEFLMWTRDFPPASFTGDGLAVIPFTPRDFRCPRCRKSHDTSGNRDNLCGRCNTVIEEDLRKEIA